MFTQTQISACTRLESARSSFLDDKPRGDDFQCLETNCWCESPEHAVGDAARGELSRCAGCEAPESPGETGSIVAAAGERVLYERGSPPVVLSNACIMDDGYDLFSDFRRRTGARFGCGARLSRLAALLRIVDPARVCRRTAAGIRSVAIQPHADVDRVSEPAARRHRRLSHSATLVSAWRHHRRTPRIFWPTLAAFLLVGFQGWLGGVVVQQELAAWIVTLHMLVALVIVSLLFYATVYAFFAPGNARRPDAAARRRLLTPTVVLMAITLVQITVGTQVREHVDLATDRGVPLAEALATVGNYDRWHRDLALLVLAATLWLVVVPRRDTVTGHAPGADGLRSWRWLPFSCFVGVTMAYAGVDTAGAGCASYGASLLLGAETVLLLLVRWLPTRN